MLSRLVSRVQTRVDLLGLERLPTLNELDSGTPTWLYKATSSSPQNTLLRFLTTVHTLDHALGHNDKLVTRVLRPP